MIIRIKNYKAKTILGIYDWEKEKPRDVVFNIDIEIDCPECKTSDKISHTLDYDEVGKIINGLTNSKNYNLIEKMANDIALKIKALPNVKRVRLEVDKPGAIKEADSVSVICEV